ncbi:hypothetical protein AALB52_25545 [Lachnospiraceae bacterium 38-14]
MKNNIPTYNDKLHETCDYMNNNREQFKDYAIYKDKLEFQRDNQVIYLHNALITQFNFLMGKSNVKINETFPKGIESMPVLNLEKLPVEKLAHLLASFYEFTCNNQKIFEIRMHLNIDKDTSYLNSLIEEYNGNFIEKILEMNNCSETKKKKNKKASTTPDYFYALRNVYFIYKQKIVLFQKDYLEKHSDLKKLSGVEQIMNKLNIYYTLLFDEELNNNTHLSFYTYKNWLEKTYPQFGNLKDIFYTWLFSSLICDALTQFLTSQNTFTPDQYYIEFLKRLNAYIIELIEDFPIQKVDITEEPQKIFFYLFAYYDFRDILLQNTYILKSITTSSSLENPQQKYIIPSSWNEKKRYYI